MQEQKQFLTPIYWAGRKGLQKWLTFVQKQFNMHNNDNEVLEFAPDKINNNMEYIIKL